VIRLVRASAAVAALAVLVACSGTATPSAETPAPSTATTDSRQQECEAAAADVVAAVERLVSGYATPTGAAPTDTGPADTSPTDTAPTETPPTATPPTETATTGTGTAPEADGTEDPAADLETAVAGAQRTVERLGCDPDEFETDVSAGLSAITPTGSVAAAVLRRVTASILGTVGQEGSERTLAPGDDLLTAVAEAAPGATLVLPEGTIELDETLVLLDGLQLRGQGPDSTVVVSTSPDAAVIVATEGLVGLHDLALRLEGSDPSSGVVAGPSASLVLSGILVTGATRGEADGSGGAGVFMSAEGEAGSGRGTTLEVTGSRFEQNSWAGIAVSGGHRVSIEDVTVDDNGEVGILFLDAASGSVARSRLTDNTIGLAATGSATPTWVATTVTGGAVGVQLDGSVEVVLQDIEVREAESAAVLVGGEVTGAISQVRCPGAPFGIVIGPGSAPTLSDNDCPLARGG
jgi:hypothetical protein